LGEPILKNPKEPGKSVFRDFLGGTAPKKLRETAEKIQISKPVHHGKTAEKTEF
jgi:hypothetical protein